MNQILFKKIYNHKLIKKFKFQLFISLLIIFFIVIYLSLFYINLHSKENFSNSILNTFYLQKLYSSNLYSYSTLESNLLTNPSIVGIIEIPKINIKYPIFSEVNDELLKISPCRFYGPYPNQIGNLCIAGHNYNDNRFFGNLYKLETNDTIYINDINNICITYSIYAKYELPSSDISCINQYTNNRKEITLVTCNNINKNRLIIKASEKKF